MSFRNPIGLAAGFDKDARLVAYLAEWGFGFVEVGTVTLLPQAGNKKPRLFRDIEKKALFNRMGFNSEGAAVVAARLRQQKKKLPQHFRVGVNIGKNRDTPESKAVDEYAVVTSFFEGLADYLVINISSPNTPGLRDMQRVETVKKIVSRVREVTKSWKPQPPILLKLAPELDQETFTEIVTSLELIHLDGLVLTNTLAGTHNGQTGGWSGSILEEKSRSMLERARSQSSACIISVGGISSEQELQKRKELGATLVQIYTSWIYEGPRWPARLARTWSASAKK